MNLAVIFAGGTGQRMNTRTRPKQFLEVHGKPIIVYTLEVFDNAPEIDGIIVVCLKEWIPYFEKVIHQFGLKKVMDVVEGGKTGQESIYNGLVCADSHSVGKTVVLVHDGVRPLIDSETISKAIACVEEHGSAVTVSPAIETITMKDENGCINAIIDRNKCFVAKAPQCFFLHDLLQAHEKAKEQNRNGFIDSATMMKEYGYSLYTVEGKPENIKITTPADYYIFKALLDVRENSELFGL